MTVPAIRSFRCIDTATILYLLAVAGIVSLSEMSAGARILLICLHLFLAGLVLLLSGLRGTIRRRSIVFVSDWYPVLAFPLLYKQVEFLAEAIGNWSLTQVIQHCELRIFGGYPHLWIGDAFPTIWVSETLHFCYFCYILLIPAIGGYWYFSGRRAAFSELLFLLAVTYYLSFFFYILYPVDSPYYLFGPTGEPASDGFFFNLVHFFSSMGGARGGAFPSLHVSVSTVILLTVLRHQRRLGYFLLPVVFGIYISTIYGRFHYALDVAAGLLLGAFVVLSVRCTGSAERLDGSAEVGLAP